MFIEKTLVEKEYQLPHIKLSALCSKKIAQEQDISDKDTIVLALHGWLDNAATFKQLSASTPEWLWCAVDFSGHGNSEHRAKGCFYHLWDYALDIVQLINKIDTKVCLIGHSMGGAVAMLIASIAPEKISHLVMLDNIGPFTAKPLERVSRLQKSIRAMGKAQNKKKRHYSNQDDMIDARMNGFTSLNHQAAKELVLRGSMLNDEQKYVWKHDPKLEITSPFSMDVESVDAFAQEVNCPTLFLLAKNGIYQKSEEFVNQRTKKVQRKTTKWLEGSHHFHLESETAATVIEEVKRFIENTKKS